MYVSYSIGDVGFTITYCSTCSTGSVVLQYSSEYSVRIKTLVNAYGVLLTVQYSVVLNVAIRLKGTF